MMDALYCGRDHCLYIIIFEAEKFYEKYTFTVNLHKIQCYRVL